MLDVQILRHDVDTVARQLKERRSFDLDVGVFTALESDRKRVQSDTESLQAKRNSLSKEIGVAKKNKDEERAAELMQQVGEFADQLKVNENELSEIQKMIATSSKTEEASIEEKPKKSTKPKKKLTSLKDDFNKKSSVFRKSSPKNKKNNSGFSSKSKRRF